VLFVSLAVAGIFMCGDTQADIKLLTAPAPIPKAGTAQVVIGQTVRLPLTASQKDGSKVMFRVIEQPKHGTLSEIRAHDTNPHSAWIDYTPGPNAKIGSDRFTYTAKLDGGKASKSVAYTIDLIAPTALLQIAPVLHFDKVEIGTTGTLQLKVRNVGTAKFSSIVRPPIPWSVAADQQRLEIDPGDEATIDVSFTPVDQKPQRYLLLMQVGNPEGQVELRGTGAPSFALLSSNLEVEWDEESGQRQGIFGVKNLTRRPLPVLIKATEGVTVASDLVLEPEETVEVPVSIDGIHAASGIISLTTKHLEQRLRVSARATPALLEVLKPEVDRQFMFALKESETAPIYEIEVVNRGGKTAFIYAETSRPFRILEGAKPIGIESGESVIFKVDVDPEVAGNYTSPLKILGASAPVEFSMVAEIKLDPESGRNEVVVADLPDAISKEDKLLLKVIDSPEGRLFGETETRRNVVSEVPTVEEVFLEKQGSRKLVFSWEHPGSSANNYIIEVEHKVIEEGEKMPHAVWKEAPAEFVKFKATDKEAFVTLKKLRPDYGFRFRVITVNSAGQTSTPTRSYMVSTLPRSNTRFLLVLPLFLVVGGGGFYFWRRRQQI